ncbi:hypothetical protein V5F49_07010 [Xanthobacter sp. V3C-3]|uniref:hypothetical protein n=1 Tax=Xanthobacter lutulentifluminis TaxID=3119935 RepID=UPI003727EA8F
MAVPQVQPKVDAMAHTRKTEQRLLSADEIAFVEKTRHPALTALPDAELADLLGHLRGRRERALTIANNQRRALRGKGGRGEATFEKADAGNRQKAAVLNDALLRVRREVKRRQAETALAELMDNAQRAFALKRDGKRATRPTTEPTANTGMRAKVRRRLERIGSSSGEAGRVTKFVAVAQARKDNRGG